MSTNIINLKLSYCKLSTSGPYGPVPYSVPEVDKSSYGRCAITSSQAYSNKLEKITLQFPEDPNEEIVFPNRTNPDLPREIAGEAAWYWDQNNNQGSTYQVKVNDHWDDTEFINDWWYWTYWSAEHGTWSASKNDRIEIPGHFALGTKNEPYISVEDRDRLKLEETFSSDITHKEGTPSQEKNNLPEDLPTVDWQEAAAIEQTAETLEELELTGTPKVDQQMSTTYATQATTAYIQSSDIGASPLTVMGSSALTGQGQVPTSGIPAGASGGVSGTGQPAGTSGQGAGGIGGQGGQGGTALAGTGGQPPSGPGGGGPPGSGGGAGLPGAPGPAGPLGGPPQPPPAQNLPPGQVGPIPAANGALKGHAPEIFDGN